MICYKVRIDHNDGSNGSGNGEAEIFCIAYPGGAAKHLSMKSHSAGAFDWIVFDYGNVLSGSQNESSVLAMADLLNLEADVFLDCYIHHRREYDRGDIDGLLYWKRIIAETIVPFDDDLVERLIKLDIESHSAVNDTMLSWNQDLRARGFRTALLSNMPREQSRHFRSNARWLSDFDVIILSAELHMRKPEPTIFFHLLSMVKSSPGRVLLLDDNLENVEAAARLGIRATLFNSTKNLLEQMVKLNKMLA